MNEGILIFLTGQDEIDSICKTIKQIVASGTESLEPIVVLPLYANMTTVKQMLVFKQTPDSMSMTCRNDFCCKMMKRKYFIELFV